MTPLERAAAAVYSNRGIALRERGSIRSCRYARMKTLDYGASGARELINARWRRVALTLIAAVAAPVLLVLVLIAFDRPLTIATTRYHFWKGGDWDVVRVDGYEEHPGFTVTGAALAMRPGATVHVSFNRQWSADQGIWISNINGLDIRLVLQRLPESPRLTADERRELAAYRDEYGMDVADTGPFAKLFPHPIRDLKDLRTHYDEVYDVLKAIADGQPAPAFKLTDKSAMDRLMATKHVAELQRKNSTRLACRVAGTELDARRLYLGENHSAHTVRIGAYRVTADGRVWVNADRTLLDDRWTVIG